MQCSRCDGHIREIRHSGSGRVRLGKARWLMRDDTSSGDLERKLENLESGWYGDDDELAAEVGTFFDQYRSVLITCAVVALFSLAVLIFLFAGIWSLGVLAVPFLGVFLVGLVLSIGLPFKIRREYLTIVRGDPQTSWDSSG